MGAGAEQVSKRLKLRMFRLQTLFSRQTALAALSGLLSILIFPTWNVEILAWIVFLPLWVAIEHENFYKTFWLGWLAGFIHFLGTMYWVTVTMVLYGGLSQFFSAAMLLLLTMYLAIYIGLFCLLLKYIQQATSFPLIAVAPVLWVGLEYVRSFFFIGFPWNLLGYSQFQTLSATQIADITGVYGVSFLIVFVNAGIYTITLSKNTRLMKIKTAVVMLGGIVLCFGYGLQQLHAYAVEQPKAPKIAVIQGNIDQDMKWDRRHRQDIFDIYANLSKSILTQNPDMIVWPETSLPFIFQYEDLPFEFKDEPHYKGQLLQLVRNLNVPLLFGGLDIVAVPPPENYYTLNTAFLLSPQGTVLSKYDKIQLVPFGEYVPFEKLLFFVNQLTTAIGRVRPGISYEIMSLNDIPFGTVICFEVIFPNLVRKFVDRGSRFLITITNDAWFGKTAAAYQHFAMVTLRAIENRVAIARSANTGISGFIDPCGRILEQSAIFVQAALAHDLPLRTATTLYTRYGDWFARLCLGLSLAGVGSVFVKTRKQR